MNSPRWLRWAAWLGGAAVIGVFALGMTLKLAHAAGTPLVAGTAYTGDIVVCQVQTEVEHLRDLVVAGDKDGATAYIVAKDNTCGVDVGADFKVLEQIGETKADPQGREWTIVRVHIQPGDLFMLTTSEYSDKPGSRV